MNKSFLKTLAFVAVATMVSYLNASAAVILTPLNAAAPDTINSVGTGTSTGTDGYDFFEAQPTASPGTYSDPTVLPSYVTSIAPDQSETGNSTGTLTISGTDYVVGDDQGAGSADMATAILGGTVPSSFNIGILVDNSAHAGANINTLTLYSGAPGALGTLTLGSADFNTTAVGDELVNHFYFMNVAGASAGDYLVVSAVTNYADGSPFLYVGGVTFDPGALTTPEPSTLALLLAGAGLLAFVVRRQISSKRL